MSEFVQLVIPAQAATLVAAALNDTISQLYADAGEGMPSVEDLRVIDQLGMLAGFFEDAGQNPRGYPVTGKMAASLKRRAQIARGVGPSKRKPKRLTRHAKRMAAAKNRRDMRKALDEQ